MKRIALISFHTCPLSGEEGKETGGMNIYVYELALALSQKGYYIDVFTRNQDETKAEIVHINSLVRVIHLEAGPKKNIPKKALTKYTHSFTKNLLAFIKNEALSYDVLDCHYYLSGMIGMQVKKTLAIPFLITFHTLALMKNLVARTGNEKESVLRIKAEMAIVRTADAIISPSEIDKEYLMYLYNCDPKKVCVISPGVNTSIFRPIAKEKAKKAIKAKKKEKIILFVGRIEPLKGIDTLIYAIKILLEKKEHTDIRLWIVGGDISQRKSLWSKELQKLEKLRKLLDIHCAVKFVGRKKPQELPYYYNSAEVAVVASQYESFGMTALEAMACNTPVITTDVTGVSNILDEKHEPLIGSAGNPLFLSEQISYILENKTYTNVITADLYQKVQDLTWTHVAGRVAHAYTHL